MVLVLRSSHNLILFCYISYCYNIYRPEFFTGRDVKVQEWKIKESLFHSVKQTPKHYLRFVCGKGAEFLLYASSLPPVRHMSARPQRCRRDCMNRLYSVRHYLRRPHALCSLGSAVRHRLRAAAAWVNEPAGASLPLPGASWCCPADKIYIYRHHSLADTPLPRHEFPSLNFASERTFALQKGGGLAFFALFLF